jgi:EF-P beta-lysylation protein EpmB
MITGITLKHKPKQASSWQKEMINAFRDVDELLDYLKLDKAAAKSPVFIPERFKLLVPRPYVDKITKADWDDPLLRQILPLAEEQHQVDGFFTDPVGDSNVRIATGVLQKYQGRVLLITTGSCALHCRYCFRRHFPYAESMAEKRHWQETLDRINQDTSLHEVILSGGDPLMLPDERLALMCQDLAAIPHIKTLRLHTRLPLVLPHRINTTLLSWLDKLGLQKVMVIHANHANEIDDETGRALRRLGAHQVTLLNQSVLLKGVNDKPQALLDLSQRLFEFGVLPYYLHVLDRVQGAAHFDVDEKKAIHLIRSIKACLPGYLVPKLVREVSGERSKLSLEKSD